MATRKKSTNATGGQGTVLRLMEQKAHKVLPPKGVKLEGKKSELMWDQLTAERPASDWTKAELFMLHRFILIDNEIDTIFEDLQSSGHVSVLNDGRIQQHPSLRILERYILLQGKLLRTLNLQRDTSDQTYANRAKMYSALAADQEPEDDLLAKPGN